MPGTFDDLTGATALSPTGGDHDSTRDFKDYNGRSSWSRNNSSSGGGQHSRSGSALDRHSESSESLDNQSTTSSGTCSKMQDFGGSTEYIPTRSTKTAPKVAYNPMQFVKTGPTKLAATAQEQLKKVEEIKKVQKEKKRDEAEDWQSNLEGWKSSRRKRQEHVIERVTEVKRMEQEEALKASEAAAKRLIGIREKRGKLSALYSVEDNDEIEFDSSSASEANAEDGGNRKGPESPGREADEVFHQTEETKKNRRPSPEYTYDKAIEDYVKYSTTALSSSSGGGNSKPEILNNSDDSSAQRKEELKRPSEKTQGGNAVAIAQSEVVQKRRSAFEASKTTTNAKSADAESSSAAAANRGEFSSSFKSRLSSFDRPPEAAPTKVTPDRDPNFRDKLANFKVAEPKVASNPPPPPVSVVPEEEPKPDFKAKLAAFRQVEASSAPPPAPPPVVVNNTPKVAPVQPKEEGSIMVKVNNKGSSQPALPSTAPPPPPPPVVEEEEEEEEEELPEEPIYANTAGGVGLDPVEEELAYQPATLDHPKEPSESSDCTEDEGIRSLSPHGTPSPTSPVQTEPKNDGKGENDPSAGKWPPSEVVTRRGGSTSSSGPSSDGHHRSELRKRRSDFLGFDVNAVEDDARELAEAIPPPPDLTSLLRSTAPSNYRTTPSVGHQQKKEEEERRLAAQERAIIETLEKEEKERVSRINSGSLLNQSHDGSECNEMTAEIDQLALEWAADAMGHQAVSAGWKPTVHNNNKFQESFPSPPPPEEPKVLPPVAQPRHSMPSRGLGPIQVTVPEQTQISSPPSIAKGRPSILTKDPIIPDEQLPSPPKPSRLSAAPKPRLHDGEAWMAKRKVASEGPGGAAAAGQTRKEPKDVSRHWLIQEAEQRRIDAMQERNYSPSSVTSSSTGGGTGRSSLTLPFPPSGGTVEQPASSSSPMSQHQWMSRSSSSNSMDKMMPELVRLQGGGPSPSSTSSGPHHHGGMTGGLNPSASSRSASSLGSSPTSRPLYANQEEILEYADFTGAPHTAPPVWQVRSLVSSGSMDQLSTISPPSRPMKNVSQQHSKSQSILPGTMSAAIHHPGQQQQHHQHHPQALYQNSAPLGWRPSNGHHSNTLPLAETKEPIAPLPPSVIQTLTQRMSQRSNTLPANNNMMAANYGDYMNIQEVVQQQQQQSAASRAGPQVPSQRPANYRHPSSSSVAVPGQQQQTNNNDRMLSVSGKKKCSLCQEELGRGAAMIIESLRLFYHINCFRCCVCGIALGNGTAGTDVRVRNNNLHCHDCYSNDDGLKFSKV